MVFAFLKAIPFGIFLTIIVCMFIGSAGSTGGFLNIRSFDIAIREFGLYFDLYWSWILFLIGTGLSFAILWMMD
ncbi:hypothetical protein [Alteraurantiacibacter aquimixticola]|uniref:Uncharacterized protein n=1 Tax=Alteraurantiacibacter aquimixticola TaxID=2489173 RepID=A0A4T3EZB2_9SPHN|nr:hypothetical protein [Alteraurantiacibacter aquimixticola]TIX48884.1 hypothetical protein E5222_14175 [Alteraurantiacibacter aquimixticola]